MALKADWEMWEGDDVVVPFHIDVPTEVDISAWTFEYQAARRQSSSTNTFKKTTAGGHMSVDNAAKIVRVAIAAVDTAGFPGGHFHTLVQTNGGARTTLSYGTLNVRRRLT